jgi:hypothetical protein
MPIISSITTAKRIPISTNSPQTSHKVTHSADSHITTHIRYTQWKITIVYTYISFHFHSHLIYFIYKCAYLECSICLLQIMQETLSFFMFMLHVKDKNEERNRWNDEEERATYVNTQRCLSPLSYGIIQYSIQLCTLNNTAPHTIIV